MERSYNKSEANMRPSRKQVKGFAAFVTFVTTLALAASACDTDAGASVVGEQAYNANDYHSSYIATAQSVQQKGEAGLLADGFTEKMIESQDVVRSVWSFNLKKDGVDSLSSIVTFCAPTIIDLPDLSGIGTIGVTHCYDPEYIAIDIETQLQNDNPNSEIQISGVALNQMQTGGTTFMANGFGQATDTFANTNYLTDKNTQEGITLSFFPYEGFDANTLNTIRSEALTMDDLWFDAMPANTDIYAYCPAAADKLPTVLEKGKVFGLDNLYLEIGIATSRQGCSSMGYFFKGPDDKTYMFAVHEGRPANQKQSVMAIPLSGLTRDQFWNLAVSAKISHSIASK